MKEIILISMPSDLYNDPIDYRQRTRAYYEALGYATPYRWAQFMDVPFAPLKKPLNKCSVALITTAAPYKEGAGNQGPGAAYNAAAKFYSVYELDSLADIDVRIAHVAYDRVHTTATDPNSWLPLAQLHQVAGEGVIGKVADRIFGLPTNRSHRITQEVDCPDLLTRIQSHDVDVCVLVPNCPVCHQSVSFAARILEQAGIATVILGCARDIAECVGVARLLFSDFPLGNAAGKPHDVQSQRDTLMLGLKLLMNAPAARTTVQSPQRWSDSTAWKRDYCKIEGLTEEQLATLRSAFDQQKTIASGLK